MALWTFIDPSFFQRCKAAASPKLARQSIVLSVVCWMVFDFLTLSTGLYAKALMPNLEKPCTVYPCLAIAFCKSDGKVFFFVGMLATVMSTLNSMVLVSLQSLMRDFFKKDNVKSLALGVWLMAAVGCVTALALPSVVQLWYVLASAMVPGLLLPMMFSYFGPDKVSSRAMLTSMVLGVLVASVWVLIGWWHQVGAYDQFPLGIQPMFAGLLASAVPVLLTMCPFLDNRVRR